MSATETTRPTTIRLSGSSSDDAIPLSDLNTVPDSGVFNTASPTKASKLRVTLTILQPSLVNFFCSFSNGVITVGLPVIARSIDLPRSLYLWPASVGGLTTGSTLLLAGSVADMLGAKKVDLVGCLLLGIFTLACGFSQAGLQLVVFRALQGIALAMHLPSSVAIVANTVPRGRPRNIGFACLGLSQPLGFSVGLVASGVLIRDGGWRSAFYLPGAALLALAAAAFWGLPKVEPEQPAVEGVSIWKRLLTDIDWVGGLIASSGLAILAYILAVLSADLTSIRTPSTATLLPVSIVLLVAFPFWMNYCERHQRPALVPNALWNNMSFTSTCIMVGLSYAVMNAMELFSSLYFQEIQDSSTLATSLKLLPNLLSGAVLNLSVGLFVDKLPARWLVSISSLLASGAPLMMALVKPEWSYWYMEFWAQMLSPMSADVLFTVGLIIVSDVFPEKSQGLAGAVFNTVGQFGLSLGMGVCQLVALGVTGESSSAGHGGSVESLDETDPAALLRGYQASFWTMFACMTTCAAVAVMGLRKVGTVGLKRE
ncbi:uncharacterized protein HMPREF1541_03444 [Cyphellophora europaea CBS 101466]|uniref:Major facilitator superfamily (MFS) profile domain-containing protein n=1 Tax=Cyphellophora europaea (strain CBS 101466) TaxID=1220924 RepID=W2S0E9_CYPE1|nr:uncharacterized protein HMPREF1541_03444 [Cyphellophora europaea CBS 101466]ETN41508.1 hypothetical protein HMPREF1541_03444 [Cyphellophora europaea CBS 101466]